MMLNIALLAPTPRARVSTTRPALPRLRRIARTPNVRSCRNTPIGARLLQEVHGPRLTNEPRESLGGFTSFTAT